MSTMQNKLQELTDRLYNEGLSKGKQEAEALRARAEEEARQIVEAARAQAAEIVAAAEKQAEDLRGKTQGDVEMAARKSLAALREALCSAVVASAGEKPVKALLENDAFLREFILAVAGSVAAGDSPDLEMVLPASLKDSLEPFVKSALARSAADGLKVSFSDRIGGGLTLVPKDGGYFIDLSDEAFRALVSAYLRPATRKILFG